VGTQTFGKGSVQTVFPIENGGAVRLTTAKYYTPNGRSIQNVGITPDIEVKLPTVKEPKDGEAVHVMIREKDLDRHLKNDTVLDEKKKDGAGGEDFTMEVVPKDEKDDIQIQKALEILKTAVKAEDVFKSIPVAAKTEVEVKK
jgi:carboxyl-terminal processing protease